jgi:hypothetical protein
LRNQQSPIRSLEHRSENILIDKHEKPIDKDIELRMFQVADLRLMIADVGSVSGVSTGKPATARIECSRNESRGDV